MPTWHPTLRSAGASLQRTRARVSGWACDAGLLPYRAERWTADQWQEAYRNGQLEYFAEIVELARYSVIGGYATALGGAPRVLDVGCGTGLLLDHLGGVAYARYLGLDTTATAIAGASSRVDDRTTFHLGDLDSVASIDLGSFDVVVLNEVLYYVTEPDAMLRRIHELLGPGGSLLTSMWRHPGDQGLWRWIDRSFEVVDRVEVRNRANALAPRGWLVAWHRKPSSQPREV